MTWDEGAPWAAAQAAGMLTLATVALDDCPTPAAVWVDFRRPDELVVGGLALSAEYVMTYRVADLPGLTEGNEVNLDGVLFRVRDMPRVAPRGTGFERFAILTRVDP